MAALLVYRDAVALGSLRHKIFDLGAFTVLPGNHQIVFSRHLMGGDTFGLHLIEPVAFDKIATGGCQDPYLHDTLVRIFLLAASQSSNPSSPRLCIASLSARTSSCQAGEDTAPVLLHKSSQSDSMA